MHAPLLFFTLAPFCLGAHRHTDMAATENALLGALVDDLQRQLAERPAAKDMHALHEKLQQTEDALLDTHEECRQLRHRLNECDAALEPERRLRMALEQRVGQLTAAAEVSQRVLVGEVSHLEQMYAAEANHGYAAQLRNAAGTAVRGMHEAQAECTWLHEQLQTVLQEAALGGGGNKEGAALRQRLASAAAVKRKDLLDRTESKEGMLVPRACAADPHAIDGTASASALRIAYVRAVQRCHELQMDAARIAESDTGLRPELLRCRERIAALQFEVDGLRRQARLTTEGHMPETAAEGKRESRDDTICLTPPSPTDEPAAPPPAQPATARTSGVSGRSGRPTPASHRPLHSHKASPQPSSAGTAAMAEAAKLRVELSRANAKVGDLQRAMERREADHRADLQALYACQREAEGAHRTLMSERAWIQSLDEMRLDDLSTIANLELRLQQWQARFDHGDPARAPSRAPCLE